MQAGHGRLPAELDDLKLPHDGVALHRLREPVEPVRDGEDGIVVYLPFAILSEQKRRGLPAGEVQGESLHEGLELDLGHRGRARFPDQRAEGVHDDEGGAGRLHLPDVGVQDRVEVLLQHHLTQVDEADRGADLRGVEELKLLLVAQHLEGGFPEDGEVEGRPGGRGIGEDDLVGEGGLSAPRRAGEDVEGQFREAAPQHRVQTRHAGGESRDTDLHVVAHRAYSCVPGGGVTKGASGQTSASRRLVIGSPTKM